MANTFGPIELVAFEFPDDRIPQDVKSELLALVASQQVRIIDLVVVRRPEVGEVEVIEVHELDDDLVITDVELSGSGLTGQEDIDEIADGLPPGTSALVMVIEHVWSMGLVGAVRDAGGFVLAAERIPAEVVEALLELASDEDTGA
ncbi:DUF6325 family protein [Cellulomonas composti]|nr:DUF6325 family protein [Cellulomonas composti]